ncbi:hypothetical protein ACTSKR_01940 [Chitinibacteraceae bacterium HSL-7]
MTRSKRPAKETVLVLCEGPSDVAFLRYLVQLRRNHPGAAKATIRPAGGKGADNVIHTLLGTARCQSGFDRLVAVCDADIEASPKQIEALKKKNGHLVVIRPHCLEGLLLELLGQRPGINSKSCKQLLSDKLKDPLDPDSYGDLLPHLATQTHPILDELFRLL